MLKISQLELGYNSKTLVNISEFNLAKKEHCLISGNSGSGKTTLLYAIAGFLKPLKGKIEIDNFEITKASEKESDEFRGKNIAVIFQNFHLIKSLTVFDNLLLSYNLAGLQEDKNYALEILNRLEIKDLAQKFPHQISQGQIQRVAIARAALTKPKIILADEPTSNLDDNNASKAIDLLIEIADLASASLIISTHDNRIKKHFSTIISLGETK